MVISSYEAAALAAASCWAITGIISPVPAQQLGALAFNRLRQICIALLLLAYVLVSGLWRDLQQEQILILLISGFIGIFLGDTLLFVCMNRLGPRRTGILFAMNAPMAAILGWLVLHETIAALTLLGMALTLGGVALAILFGKRKQQSHKFENTKGKLWIGIAMGLGAALGQAVGSVLAKPVMASGVDPFVASMVRVGFAAVCLTALMQLPYDSLKQKAPTTMPIAIMTVASGFIALALGMSLMLYALSGGNTGVVSTLSATTPVIILPLLWASTGERPAAGAWIGAALVVCGLALIVAGRG